MQPWCLVFLCFVLSRLSHCKTHEVVYSPALQTVKKGQIAQLDFKLEKAEGDFTVRKYNNKHQMNQVPGEEILFVRFGSAHASKCEVQKPYQDIRCYLSARDSVTVVIRSFSYKYEGRYKGNEVGPANRADLRQSRSKSEETSCTVFGNGTLSTSTCTVANTDSGHDVTCNFTALPIEEDNKSFFVEKLQTDFGDTPSGPTYCHYSKGDNYRCSHDGLKWFNVQRTTHGESFSVTVSVPFQHHQASVGFLCKSTSASVFIEEHPCFLTRDGMQAIQGCSTFLFLALVAAAVLLGIQVYRNNTMRNKVTAALIVLCVLSLTFSFVTVLLSFTTSA